MFGWGKKDVEEEPKKRKMEKPVYAIFSGAAGTLVGLKHSWGMTEKGYLPPTKDTPAKEITITGRAFNQVSFRSYVEGLERMGYDMDEHKDILSILEQATEKAGQTDIMNKLRIVGAVVGDIEQGTAQIYPKSIVPVGPKPQP